jgi:hypothetical protein
MIAVGKKEFHVGLRATRHAGRTQKKDAPMGVSSRLARTIANPFVFENDGIYKQ